MPISSFARTYLDYSKEKATAEFRIRDMTAATIAALLTEAAALGTAIDALSLGTRVKSILSQDNTKFAEVPPTDLNAQRERKWRVDFQDTVNLKPGKIEIPVANIYDGDVPLLQPNSDMADLTEDLWVNFITAFETTARSVDGNTVNVLSAQLVGRNL